MPESAERSFVQEPELPDTVSASELDADVRRDLRGLQKETAESVARHLVAAGMLVDEEPEQALEHARYARKRASRIAVVREASGIVAYHAGEWNEALGEFRAARRMGGGPGHVPVMADIERALGRPERALDLARSPEARELSAEERVELLIVAAGARRDLGEFDAAVVGLQVPELDAKRREPWSARLFYAYADNLLAVGRESEALEWFVHAHDADADGQTDAGARIAEITGEELPGSPDDDVLVGIEDVPGPVPAGAVDQAHGAEDPDESDGEDDADTAAHATPAETDTETDSDADSARAADTGPGGTDAADAGTDDPDRVDDDLQVDEAYLTDTDDEGPAPVVEPATESDMESDTGSDTKSDTEAATEPTSAGARPATDTGPTEAGTRTDPEAR
ncbi:tetratricopeptide repeat protein [Pseudonocardia phyllosphaerae]|uniref:hypothetical protein n=1 Tax=Pseudonocardia phyllosphaerae TaxID=3390502 RepID=UPI003978AA89